MAKKTNSDYVYVLDCDNSKAYQVLQQLSNRIFIAGLFRGTSIHNWETFGGTHVIVCRTKTKQQTSLFVVENTGRIHADQLLVSFPLVMVIDFIFDF